MPPDSHAPSDGEERFEQALLDAVACAVVVLDADGYIVALNRAGERMSGHRGEDVWGKRMWDVLIPEHARRAFRRSWSRPDEDLLPDGREDVWQAADGSHRLVVWSGRRVEEPGDDRRPLVVASAIDVTRQRQNEIELQHRAEHDALTGVYNRHRFRHELTRELARARRSRRPLSLVLADLDDLKRLNDEHGHPRGDEALRRMASVVRTRLRESDSVARIGGDEFAVLLPETGLRSATALASELCTLLAATELPCRTGTVPVTASLGVTSSHPDDTPDELLERADAGLYAAKEAGRNTVAACRPPRVRRRPAVARRRPRAGADDGVARAASRHGESG